MSDRLLVEFEKAFAGHRYRHRSSTTGDRIAWHLYEDMLAVDRSGTFSERVSSGACILNAANTRRGISARRGDGTFGEGIPGSEPLDVPAFSVRRGPVATIEIGVEVKILAKAMQKQLDRVIGDLRRQAEHFRRSGNPICVGVVGVNHAPVCTSYEGSRKHTTDGKKYRHPIQEAESTIERLGASARAAFDELLVLRFAATNQPPYEFAWVDPEGTRADYSAALVRISREYDRRFG